MLEWRIFYSGGKTFSNLDGTPFDAPTTGVLLIVKADERVGRLLLTSCDYYWWEPKHQDWFSGDIAGFWQYLMCDIGPKCVLFGRYVSNDEFHRATMAALNDPDLPPKTARDPREPAL